jgi:hypothetical protein
LISANARGRDRGVAAEVHMFWYLIFALVLTSGCAEEEKEACVVGDLDAVATATIDGSDWAASGGTWSEAGSAIQVSLESAVDLVVTLRASTDGSGEAVADRVARGDFPILVDLGASYGHGGIQDMRNGLDAFTSTLSGGGGLLTISGLEGDTLSACFEFVAVNDDGRTMEVGDGKVMIER